MTIRLFDFDISDAGLDSDVRRALESLDANAECKYMACANPHSLVVASQDSHFKEALQNADILLPDGSGVVLAAKILHAQKIKKVAGFDFFVKMCSECNLKGKIKFFFLGSNDHVLALITKRLKKEFPAIEVCGTYSPPYKEVFSKEDNENMVNTVNRARPHILWVGMTAPKQEKWLFNNIKYLNVPFAAAIGAVFDFYAGTKERSSEIWIKLGLEWLPRFLKEPRRLWERNLKSTPIFLWWILREKIRQML